MGAERGRCIIWVATRYGFFSAVCARKGDGSRANPPDPHKMMIRARARDHLVRLVERFPSLKRFEIKTSPHNDYRFRIIIPKWRWQRVMWGLIREQDYDNFKNEVDRTFGTKTVAERRYHDRFLMPVWGTGYRFQTASYGPGIYDNDDEPKSKSARKRKPKKAVQTTLLPPPRKPHPVDTETSPFPGDGTALVKIGPEPFGNEQVLVVTDQATSREIVVVWNPAFYESDARAYADAIQAGIGEIVAHPEFKRMIWTDAKKGGAPVFDPSAQTV